MKFVCSNCSTQYLISDDKVGSKGVKVRCKRCGNVIIVRPSSEEDETEDPMVTDPGSSAQGFGSSDSFAQEDGDDVGQAFDQLLAGGLGGDDDEDDEDDERATEVFNLNDVKKSKPSFDDRDKIDQVFAGAESTELRKNSSHADDKAEWYVAIGDEQVGPISMAEIEARWRDGEIGPKTLSWCPGMDNWLPLQEVEALSNLLGDVSQVTRDETDVDSVKSREDSPREENNDIWAPYQGSELASLVEEEMAAVESSPPPEEKEEGDILGGALNDDEEVPPWEQEDPPSGLVAKTDDSFFDSTLDASSADSTGGTYSRSGVLAGPAYLGTPKKKSKFKWIVIGVVSAIVLVAGAVVVYFMSLPQEHREDLNPVLPPDIHVDSKNDKKDTADIKAGSDSGKSSADKKSDSKEDVKKTEDKDKKKKEKKDTKSSEIVVAKATSEPVKNKIGKTRQSTTKKNRGKRRKKKKKRNSTEKTSVAASKKNSSASASAVVDSSLPNKLSKAQIGKTMMEYVQSMRTCVQDQHRRDPTVTGVMKVSFTIQPNGRVKGIRVLTKEHNGTYVAGCISYIIKSIHFPKAQGPSKVPVLPLKLGGS